MDPLDALEMDAGVAGGQAQELDPLAALEADAGLAPAKPVPKPFLGIDLSKNAPAKTYGRGAWEAVKGMLAGAWNLPGSAARGAYETYTKPAGEQFERLKQGASNVGKGILETAQGVNSYLLPGMFGPSGYSTPEGQKLLTGPMKALGGVFEGTGLTEAGDVAAQAAASMAPPQPETPSWLFNLAADVPGQIVTPAAAMFATDPTIAYAAGKGAVGLGKGAANLVEDMAKMRRAPEINTDEVLKALNATPDTGHAETIRTMITGERGTNPELPSTMDFGLPPAEGTTKATDWDLKHGIESAEGTPFQRKPPVKVDERPMIDQLNDRLAMDAEATRTRAWNQLEEDAKVQKAVSKNGKPHLGELSGEELEAQRQQMLDDLAKESKTLQATLGLKNDPDIGLFDNYVNVYSATPMAKATEMLNRGTEEAIRILPEYMKARDAAVDLLKKPNKFGFFVRDRQAEEKVAQALDGKIKFEELAPKEQESYNVARAALDKIAKLEGLDIKGQTLHDYWYRTLGKDHPLVADLAKKGYLFDPATGEMAVPSKAGFEKHRKPDANPQDWNYNLGDVLGMRLSIGVRKAIMDPIVYDISQEAEKLGGSSKSYLKSLLDRVQGRPGESEILQDKFLNGITKGLADTIKGAGATVGKVPGVPQRAIMALGEFLAKKGVPGQARRAQQMISRAYYRYMLGLALDTATKNLLQGVNTMGVTGIGNELKGVGGYGKLLFSKEAREAFQKANINPDMALLHERTLDKGAFKVASDAIDKGLFKPMELTEAFNRGLAYQAGRAEAVQKFAQRGIKNPAEWMIDRYAKHFVDLTQFKYGAQNINPHINNPLGKLYYQFATYPAGQLNLMRQLWRNKQDWVKVGNTRIPSRLIKLLAIQGMVGVGFKEALGSDVWDTLGWGSRLFGKEAPAPIPGVGVMADVAGRLPIPGANNLITGERTLTSPATQLVTSPSEMLLPLILGTAHVPGRFLKKLGTASDEMTTHKAVNKKGQEAYDVTEEDSLLKLLGLKPRVQQEYIQNILENQR